MKTNALYKKIIGFVLSVIILLSVPLIFCACTEDNTYKGDLLRLHIRANSNSIEDQAVKYKVRDEINSYLSEHIDKSTFDEAYAEIRLRLGVLSKIAARVLADNGFDYGANATLGREYFPERKYGDVTVPEGEYDALIIGLGSAKGDNWWCVVYPPLCYGESFEYKSFFAELFGASDESEE